jgi:hypothetical protein
MYKGKSVLLFVKQVPYHNNHVNNGIPLKLPTIREIGSPDAIMRVTDAITGKPAPTWKYGLQGSEEVLCTNET